MVEDAISKIEAEIEKEIESEMEDLGVVEHPSVVARELISQRNKAKLAFIHDKTNAKLSKRVGDEQSAAASFKSAAVNRKKITAIDQMALEDATVAVFYKRFMKELEDQVKSAEDNTMALEAKSDG